MKSRIDVRNSRSTPLTVWVEPWARDFTLLSEDEFSFVALMPGQDFYFHALWEDHRLLLCAVGSCEDVAVYQSGVELFCGHNRGHVPQENSMYDTPNAELQS